MIDNLYAAVRDWLATRTLDARVDPAELAAVLDHALAGVDLDRNGTIDALERDPSTPLAVTPLERLELMARVSRDFREAGKGKAWDRVREYDPKTYGWPRNKERGQSRGVRPWSRIDTICLHTAGTDGLHPDRWLGVPCHSAVASDATVVLCHHGDAYLYAAHALNRRSISIEIAGNRTITEAQIEPARALVRYHVDVLRERHARAGITKTLYVSPHRHSHSSRTVDTDIAIWRAVGEWAIAELDLELGEVMGSGKPIPREWWSGRLDNHPGAQP